MECIALSHTVAPATPPLTAHTITPISSPSIHTMTLPSLSPSHAITLPSTPSQFTQSHSHFHSLTHSSHNHTGPLHPLTAHTITHTHISTPSQLRRKLMTLIDLYQHGKSMDMFAESSSSHFSFLPLSFLLHPSSSPSSPFLLSLPLPPEAAPTESEREVHSKVAQVLVKAPEILSELRSYKGAGEQIREVCAIFMHVIS